MKPEITHYPRFRVWLATVVAFLLLSASAASASPALNLDSEGVAVHGYDVVSYFTEGRPVKGSRFHEVVYENARYRFANEDTAAKFQADPERYLPAYGGYCSYGVAMGKKFDIDPEAWAIVDGRLYFQLDRGTRKAWRAEASRNIAIADRMWPALRDVPAEQLVD